MLLRSVRLENFRAVNSARVSFEPTTVLIGENDCGRSSVMEAIALALGWNCAAGEFRFQPFHAHRAGGVAAPAISITSPRTRHTAGLRAAVIGAEVDPEGRPGQGVARP